MKKTAPKNLKILFLGTPEFAIPVLSVLINSEFRPAAVITQPDKPVGRKQTITPPPVKVFARKYDLKIFQPEDKSDLQKILADLKPDLCILVAFGMIIPKAALSLPKFGWLNVHPSLLPKYRGSSPIQAAILAGDAETGVSIIKLSDRLDAGPLAAQIDEKIDAAENAETLSAKLAAAGADLLLSILPNYLAGTVELRDQNESQATYCSIIDRGHGQVDWEKSAQLIDRQFRAFYPWPGIFTFLDGKRLKIANLSVLEGNLSANLATGEVFTGPKGQMAVKCGEGAVVLEIVQLEGKQQVTGTDFLRGQKIIGKILK